MGKRRILVFAPHPDDEVLGCGGSIAKHIEIGNIVYITFLTNGEMSSPLNSPEQMARVRKKEACNAAKVLGVSTRNITFFEFPDGWISPYKFEQFTRTMLHIRQIKPHLVYLPHEGEESFDHQCAFQLIWRALKMAPSNNYPLSGKPWWVSTVLAYEVWTPLSSYQYGEDVGNQIKKKIKALRCYQSQSFKVKKMSKYIERGEYLAGYRAAMSIGDYREVFQVLRISTLPSDEVI